MLSIEGFEPALVKAMKSNNKDKNVWYGSINGHRKSLHFTMWTMEQPTIKVYHVDIDKMNWERFTRTCKGFIRRHRFNIELIVQDGEQSLLTEISTLSIAHLAAAMDHFLRSTDIHDLRYDIDGDGGYLHEVYENVVANIQPFCTSVKSIRDNISNVNTQVQKNFIDLATIFTSDVGNALQAALPPGIHQRVASTCYAVLRSLCSSDGLSARQCIAECIAMLTSSNYLIVEEFKEKYRPNLIVESLENVCKMIPASGDFELHSMLLSFDYDVPHRKLTNNSGIAENIINGRHYPPGTFKSIFGNCDYAVEFVKIDLMPQTIAQLKLFCS